MSDHPTPYPHRDQWSAGERAKFYYSLAPDPASEISARLAHRTGQTVTVLSESESATRQEMPTIEERSEAGELLTYTVRFEDGHTDSAFEDELLDLDYAE